MCVYVCVFFFLLCGAVSCRVPRVVGWLGGLVWCGVADMSLSVVIEKYKEEERARKKWREGR